MFNRKFDFFRTHSDEKKFTFWAITPVLVGIFQICLHIWKLEKKCNRKCANRFFLSSRESVQNRTRRSNFWITIFQHPEVLKIGPTPREGNRVKPRIPNQIMLNSTTCSLDKLDKFEIKTGDKMVSFDLVSLFTNAGVKKVTEC